MTEDRKNVLPSPDQTHDRNVRISPSELLSLLDTFHEKVDAFFEEMRTFLRLRRDRTLPTADR